MSLSVIPSTEQIARVAPMKNPSPEKVWKLQHVLQVNEMHTADPLCPATVCTITHNMESHGPLMMMVAKSGIDADADILAEIGRDCSIYQNMIMNKQQLSRGNLIGSSKWKRDKDRYKNNQKIMF
jgi:hypothetical protein